MKEHFLSFELSKKLKENGFTCKYPFAMYNELGQFCPLFTSSDKYQCKSGYQYREYFDFDDFDEKDVIAPTVEQVLKWLREEKKFYMYVERDTYHLKFRYVFERDKPRGKTTSSIYDTYELAALAGIEHILDNLI